jgi:hypothetical protein
MKNKIENWPAAEKFGINKICMTCEKVCKQSSNVTLLHCKFKKATDVNSQEIQLYGNNLNSLIRQLRYIENFVKEVKNGKS